jgi:molybdopterin-guanine dinucleotide biosynthesis protein A
MTLGIVLAGGASARFGGVPKGLQLFRGRAMALCVADVLSQVAERVVIEAPPGAGYEKLGLPLIHAAPAHAGKGPLAGMAAGLGASVDASAVAFAPCDMPCFGEMHFRVCWLRWLRTSFRAPPTRWKRRGRAPFHSTTRRRSRT